MFALAPNSRVLGQFSALTQPVRTIEGSLREHSVTLKVGDKSAEVVDFNALAVPFVGLASYGSNSATFSEIQIHSPGPIPREVALLDEGLTGWSAGWFGHPLPQLPGKVESGGGSNEVTYFQKQQTENPCGV